MCVAEGQPSTDGSAGTVVSFTAKAKGVVLGLLLTSVIFIITFLLEIWWFACPLAFGCWLLEDMIYLKLR